MYYLILAFTYAISILPLGLLYLISDGLYLIVYYLVRYRKKTVFENLRQSFPEKSPAEITKLARSYYRNLMDMTVETVKLLTMSKKSLEKRFK